MDLSNIFTKPVDRPLEGVIKADDLSSLRLEVEEYVLTNEVESRLENFLDAYNHYEGANGVWISGFFGSGKSHLLKMLALLFDNREIDGIPIIDSFIPKCEHNKILSADLKKACELPSKSILFNIDQKASIISKTDFDALLAVFVKVFDEMCGYYGKQAYIAQFERDLDSKGLYKSFQEKYQEKSGKPWTEGREEILFESDNIASAYAEASGASLDSGKGILDKYRDDYNLSIEDFAVQINNYIKLQEPNFRLNFFVDEVGQYIADNTKLMTNLQTIAESLATKCDGKAWIIVTAQEDMNTVIGELGKQQSDDFSKIQARFANRLKLTSQDVAEVIQKRLLMKNDKGVELLSDLYHQEQTNFKTLFNFVDGSQTYKNFEDRDHFIQAYPFIPYQFTLFQASIQALSTHNAFEGRHSSVGERSMLGVFQQVVVHIAKYSIGQLATFDLMFEGIRTALKANAQMAIITAEKNLDNPFAVRLLKALFLVKYIKGFKATIRNICVLMLESFDINLGDLKKQVEESLNLLEQQTYIQRNGEEYEFLTNEEKDIENEIKNTDVENSAVAEELEKIIFDQIIKNRKIRYEENGQDYLFSRKLDDRLFGREYELSINVISPFHEHSGNEDMIRAHSLGKPELTVLMPSDPRIYTDLVMYKKTEKYIRHNQGTTLQETISRILAEKANQNRRRMTELEARVLDQMGKSRILVAGEAADITSEDAVFKINKGFYELITRMYPNLRMLRNTKYKEQDVSYYLKESGETLFGNNAVPMSEPENEMLSFINMNSKSGVRSTIKLLVEKFEKKPYGWPLASIQCVLAMLCARAKVEARQDSISLEDNALANAIINTAQHSNIVLIPQIEFTNVQIRNLQTFFEDFFDTKTTSKEPKVLGKEVISSFKTKVNELNLIAAQKSQYSFLGVLEHPISILQSMTDKNYAFYLTELETQEDLLFDLKEKVIDPILRFMEGSSKVIFDETQDFISAQKPNFSYLPTEKTSQLLKKMEDPSIYRGGIIQQIKSLRDELDNELKTILKAEIEKAKASIQGFRNRIFGLDEFKKLNASQQNQISHVFEDVEKKVENQSLIAVIKDLVRQFEEDDYTNLLNRITFWNQPKAEEGSAGSSDVLPKTSKHESPIVSVRSINVEFNKAFLDSEQDVDDYLTAFKEAVLAEIETGKRVRI